MRRAFISHRTSDRPFVEAELLPLLQHFGIDTWYCKLDIAPGDVWEKEIRDGLESCDWFIVVLSPQAVRSQSPWIHAEVCFAFDHREGRIIPVVIEPVATVDVHLRLPTLQAVDFTGTDRTGARLRLLERFDVRVTEADLPSLNGAAIRSSPLLLANLANPEKVEVKPVRIASPKIQVPRYSPPQIEPPLQEEILRHEGLLAGLAEVTVQVEQDCHEALLPGKEALEEAKQQWQKLHDDLDGHPLHRVSEQSRQQIEHRLAENPDADFAEVYELLRLVPPRDAEAYFHRVRNVARARREFERGQALYESNRQKILTRLGQSCSTTAKALMQLQQQDQEVLLQELIQSCASLDQFEAPWQELLSVMRQRRYLCPLPEQARVRTEFIQSLDERTWSSVEREGTDQAYQEYLRAFDQPRHADEARQAQARFQQERAWQQAVLRNTKEEFQAFLHTYPDSPRAPEARKKIRLLVEAEASRIRQATAKTWRLAKQLGTIEAYEAFLREWSNSNEAEEARKLRTAEQERLRLLAEAEASRIRQAATKAWRRAKKLGTIEAYEVFLCEWPNSNEAEQARKLLTAEQERKCWERVEQASATPRHLRRAKTVEILREYLVQFPHGQHAGEARDMLVSFLRERVCFRPTDRAARTEYLELRTDKYDKMDSTPVFLPAIGILSAAFSLYCTVVWWFRLVEYGLPEFLAYPIAFVIFVIVLFFGIFGLGIVVLLLLAPWTEKDANPMLDGVNSAALGPLPLWDSLTLSFSTLRRKYLGEEPVDKPATSNTVVTPPGAVGRGQ